MVDLQETPATPPVDYEGDERYGWIVGGALLIALGWGLGVVGNLLLHAIAPASGLLLVWVRIFPTLGVYAWAVVGLGLFTGAFGTALLALGGRTPRGRFVLPGYDYRNERSP